MTPTNARPAAALTIDRILRTGAYSNVVVRNTEIDPATDHRFYERLVYTTLRYLPLVDNTLAEHSTRRVAKIDPLVAAVLRIGIAEALYLGTASHAVANEAVEATRALRKPEAAGFVNGVLRSVIRANVLPNGSLHDSYPSWMIERLEAEMGRAEAEAFLLASNEPASTGIRPRPSSTLAPGARYAEQGEDVDSLALLGEVDVMDPASAAVVEALAAEPGMLVLDLAAAPGGKTRALADAVGPSGLVIAADHHVRRLNSARMRSHTPDHIDWLVADASDPPLKSGSFDRVLLDAPCTGLGTIRRRPEIRYRIEQDAPERYGATQRVLIERALGLVAPGGVMVYSVCTVFVAETTEAVAGLGFAPPMSIEGHLQGDGVMLGPHIGGTDGMFISRRDV